MNISKTIKKYQILIAAILIVAVVAVVINNNPTIINNTYSNQTSNTSTDTTPQPSIIINVNVPTSVPYVDERAPTSLYVTVEPNPITVGNRVMGEIVSNGYNYPITIHAKHVGANVEQTFGGLIDDYGQFYHSQTLTIAGYWDFWATTDTTTSNTVRLSCQGVTLTLSGSYYSKTFSQPITVKVYSHSSGTCQIFANDPAHSVTIPITTVHINSGGYGETTITLGTFTNGNYEIDALINGLKASDYSSSQWVTVGR